MRPPIAFRLARVRLINFHNFVDETVELRGGGHLFLLGDNGSGKTTVLDAIHYVLSGGEGIELNAAARLGGRRDEGRTIQGVVLRYDFERGVRNEGGAIAYAALELEGDGGARLCLAVGVEATTMDARPARWGVMTRRSLAELPLLESDVPCGRELLRERLGRSDVFFQLGEYRRHVADRLFGGEAGYREVCRFWSMAKAYREIVAGAADLGALFRRLLPAPDGETFTEILRSLRAIEEIEVALGGIAEQRAYVAGLLGAASEVAELRQAAARYRWLLTHREREDERARAAAASALSETLEEAIAEAGRETAAAEARRASADEAVRAVERAEGGELLAALRRAGERVQELGAEAVRREREVAGRARAASVAAAERAGEAGALARALEDAAGAIERERQRAALLPGALAFAGALAARVREAAACVEAPVGEAPVGEAMFAAADAARGLAAGEVARARKELAIARAVAASAVEEAERVTVARDALAASAEDAPMLPGVAAALAALAAAGIDAAPLCACLETRPAANGARVADLERLAGPEVMGAMVVAAGRAAEALAVVRAVAPELRVAVRTARATLPPWAEELLVPAVDERGATAVAVLGAALVQPAALGEPRAADQGLLELRGLGWGAGTREPRWLGSEARRASRRAHLDALERELAAAVGARSAAEARARLAGAALEAHEALVESIAEVTSRHIVEKRSTVAASARRAATLEEEAARARREAAEATGHAEAARRELDALSARAGDAGVREIEVRLAGLRDARAAAAATCDALVRERARREADRERAMLDAQTAAQRASSLDAELARASDAVRYGAGLTGDDDAIAHHVRVVHRGDSFRSTEAVREKIRECERRAIELQVELGGDGSRGVRFLGFAAQFGFDYQQVENRLVDRRDQPAAGILVELDRTLAEQRELAGERTRDLMERLVMGSLARDLQEQVESLHRAVRDINRLLAGLRFGATEYQLTVAARPDRRELVDLVRSLSLLDDDSRRAFRGWIEDRLADLRGGEDGVVPEVLDYRTWFDVRIRMRTTGAEGVDLTRSLRVLGSGGEQGVPNYLIVFALGKLLFDSTQAAVRPLLFDEAFYGIDAGRRDQLLRFASDCGLQIAVASPDQDGATPAVQQATTLFVVKDEAGDVHLFPYHYWNRSPVQGSLLEDGPAASAPEQAQCGSPPHEG